MQPGDEVLIKYWCDSAGRSIIRALYANIDPIWGRITSVTNDGFEVDQNFNADPESAYRRGLRQIAFDSETQFESSSPEDLSAGRTVDVIGLKLAGSRVQASRVIVYERNKPTRMHAGAIVIAPNGTRR